MNAQEIHLTSRPIGMPTAKNFTLTQMSLPAIQDGEVLVKNLWMSVDPYMRGRMIERKSYVPPFQLDHVLEGAAIGKVVESKNTAFPVGTKVNSMLGWRSHYVSNGGDLTALPVTQLPDQSFLGVMGMPGMTAWTGLVRIAHLKPTDTVFISAASGAVGTAACQIAKIYGCTVIGSTGSSEKVALLESLGVNAVINYKEASNLTEALAKAAPQGIDVFFENVGGEHLEAALNNMNDYGRIAVCGMISQYNATKPQAGPTNLMMLIIKKLKMEGFIVLDHWSYYNEFSQQMKQWIAEGKIKWKETIYNGIAEAPAAFIGLFEGKNKGKMLVKL